MASIFMLGWHAKHHPAPSLSHCCFLPHLTYLPPSRHFPWHGERQGLYLGDRRDYLSLSLFLFTTHIDDFPVWTWVDSVLWDPRKRLLEKAELDWYFVCGLVACDIFLYLLSTMPLFDIVVQWQARGRTGRLPPFPFPPSLSLSLPFLPYHLLLKKRSHCWTELCTAFLFSQTTALHSPPLWHDCLFFPNF